MKTQTYVSKKLLLGFGLSAITLLTGCAPESFTAQATSSLGNKTEGNVVEKQCVPDATDYLWDVNVYGFGMSGTNFDVGYNGPVAGPVSKVEVGAQINKGTLNLEMDMRKPYSDVKRTVNYDASMTRDFNFTLDVGIAKLGVGNSSDAQAAMVKLTSKGYQGLLNSAGNALSGDPNPWSTHIKRKKSGTTFVIPVGAIAGIKYGDKFDVYKYQYEFADPSVGCDSGVIGGSKLSAVPVATLIPLDIRDGETTLIIDGSSTTSVGVNDLIQVNTLFKTNKHDKRTALKKSVRILGVHQPNHIEITGGVAIDLASYLNYQMQSLMTPSPYWVVP